MLMWYMPLVECPLSTAQSSGRWQISDFKRMYRAIFRFEQLQRLQAARPLLQRPQLTLVLATYGTSQPRSTIENQSSTTRAASKKRKKKKSDGHKARRAGGEVGLVKALMERPLKKNFFCGFPNNVYLLDEIQNQSHRTTQNREQVRQNYIEQRTRPTELHRIEKQSQSHSTTQNRQPVPQNNIEQRTSPTVLHRIDNQYHRTIQNREQVPQYYSEQTTSTK